MCSPSARVAPTDGSVTFESSSAVVHGRIARVGTHAGLIVEAARYNRYSRAEREPGRSLEGGERATTLKRSATGKTAMARLSVVRTAICS